MKLRLSAYKGVTVVMANNTKDEILTAAIFTHQLAHRTKKLDSITSL